MNFLTKIDWWTFSFFENLEKFGRNFLFLMISEESEFFWKKWSIFRCWYIDLSKNFNISSLWNHKFINSDLCFLVFQLRCFFLFFGAFESFENESSYRCSKNEVFYSISFHIHVKSECSYLFWNSIDVADESFFDLKEARSREYLIQNSTDEAIDHDEGNDGKNKKVSYNTQEIYLAHKEYHGR